MDGGIVVVAILSENDKNGKWEQLPVTYHFQWLNSLKKKMVFRLHVGEILKVLAPDFTRFPGVFRPGYPPAITHDLENPPFSSILPAINLHSVRGFSLPC